MSIYQVRKFPNDTKARVAIGLDLPFNGTAVFKSNYQTKDSIKSSLINFLLTEPGERIANPTFGLGLRKFLFTQIVNDNLDFIKQDIQDRTSKYFGNLISIEKIEIYSSDINQHAIKIDLKYKINYNNLIDNITFEFS